MNDDKSIKSLRQKAKQKRSQANKDILIDLSSFLQQRAQRLPKESYQHLKFTDRVAFNNLAEEQFVELVRRLLAEQPGGTLPIWNVYQEASYELGISSETAKRYLLKHSARRAEFTSFGKVVFLNDKYELPEGEQNPDFGHEADE